MAEIKHKMKSEIVACLGDDTIQQYKSIRRYWDSSVWSLLVRINISMVIIYAMKINDVPAKWVGFYNHCHQVAQSLANPKVVFMTQHPSAPGGRLLIDDYYKGYKWIDKNTPKDSRMMAWWDYGYQITGIAKRTSIADGNTWNHEHIATLGRTLTSPEKKAWNAIRHLADFVLVWAGGRGDDIAKSPHLARIGNSVFPEHCGDADPRCNKFGFRQDGTPTAMMAESLLYKAVSHNQKPNVKLNKAYFKEA
jgi:dolichyl-diphosphooligosaccharide--protein glycosyltransferase